MMWRLSNNLLFVVGFAMSLDCSDRVWILRNLQKRSIIAVTQYQERRLLLWKEIKIELDKNGIEIPYSQVVMHNRK